MDRPRVDFDSYITSGQYHEDVEDIACIACGFKFEVEGEVEYGAFTPFNEDEGFICPNCGTDNWEAQDD